MLSRFIEVEQTSIFVHTPGNNLKNLQHSLTLSCWNQKNLRFFTEEFFLEQVNKDCTLCYKKTNNH